MSKPTDLIFKLEHQFTLYLQRCAVTREQLSADQYREMRRAFYGGLANMFFLVTQDVIELGNPRDQDKVLSSLQGQIKAFWTKEAEDQEAGRQELHPSIAVTCGRCGWDGQIRDLEVVKQDEDQAVCPHCKSPDLIF